jgi:hypothetical protein
MKGGHSPAHKFLLCESGFPVTVSGQASRDEMGYGREVYSGKAHSRGIDSIE